MSVLENRADLLQPQGEEVFCPSCGEELIFGMKDKHHDFSIGLTTVLECLAVAEIQGYVPKFPDEWWVSVYRRNSHIQRIRSSLLQRE